MLSIVILIMLMNDIFVLYNEICQSLQDLCNPVKQYFSDDQCIMLQNVSRRYKPMYYNVIEHEKYVHLVSDSTSLVEFIKEKCPKFCKKAIKIRLPFLTTYLWEIWFSWYYFNQNNILQQIWKLGFLKINPDIKVN